MNSIFPIKPGNRAVPNLHGGKAYGLWRLSTVGATIPITIVIPVGVELHSEDIPLIVSWIKFCDRFIVRSSAECEDQLSQSMAGVFSSRVASVNELLDAVQEIRTHARKIIRSDRSIPLIIQPYLTGVGGVFLSEGSDSKDHLTLSQYGVVAVTSGLSTSIDQLAHDTAEFQTVLCQCRRVQRSLGSSVDLELILKDSKCIFLQYRPFVFQKKSFLHSPNNPKYHHQPLIQFLSSIDSANELNSSILENSVSQYFPTPLSPLCGTLWVQQLRKLIESNIEYKNGWIVGLQESNGSAQVELSEPILRTACEFYQNNLFRGWNRKLKQLKDLMGKTSPADLWQETHAAWSSFLGEYFNNPYESVITSAKAAQPSGSSFSPKLRQRFSDFFKARQALVTQLSVQKTTLEQNLQLAEVRNYLNRYGHYFLNGNDFGQPALIEQPETLLAMLQVQVSIKELPLPRITPILKAAWLAEDDNDYKHRFAYLLRLAILRLGQYLTQSRLLRTPQDIWNLTATDLDKALTTQSTTSIVVQNQVSYQMPLSEITQESIFPAIVLSPGSTTGIVCKKAVVGSGSILVKTVLESTDYPALMASDGAVVALGTLDSHGALFARDINKPLYRCPAIVSTVPEGTRLSLQESSSQITVSPPYSNQEQQNYAN